MSTERFQTMADTHPGVIPWLASAGPQYSLLASLPFFAVDGWLVVRARLPSPTAVMLCAALGVVAWTFFEYAVHRWLYHTRFSSPRVRWFMEAFHLHHHRLLGDHRVLNAGLLSWPNSLLFFGGYALVMPTLADAALAHFAMTLSYVGYEYVHFQIHNRKHDRGYFAFIQRYHLFHHEKKWSANFANTSTLWDRVFGTYDARYQQFEISPALEATFICSQRRAAMTSGLRTDATPTEAVPLPAPRPSSGDQT
jgi:sterol desaturase/sphingolipid hydroxylase (fatty acid hydroxylase superfamily)